MFEWIMTYGRLLTVELGLHVVVVVEVLAVQVLPFGGQEAAAGLRREDGPRVSVLYKIRRKDFRLNSEKVIEKKIYRHTDNGERNTMY